MKKGLFCFLASVCILQGLAQKLKISNLLCEYRKNPIAIDQSNPRLSWLLQSTERNVLQTNYQILVSDDSLLLVKNQGNIWNSGIVNSKTSIQVLFAGKALEPAKKYFWKVKVSDNKGNTTQWSEIAYWQMGLLKQSDWKQAHWIGYETLADSSKIIPAFHGNGKKALGPGKDILPLLRKSFIVNKSIKLATLFISGLGHFEMSLNGNKIGDHFLDPGWTQYSKHALYVGFDLTNTIAKGENCIGVQLGNGFFYQPRERYRKLTGAYGYPKMICRLVIQYSDGTESNIITDDSWKVAPSPTIFSSIYGGEDYDASLENKGWDNKGYNDKDWKNAILTDGPELNAQMAEPVKVMQELSPVNFRQINENNLMYDVAQNMSGIPKITIQGKKGDTIKIITGELINEDGTVNQKATGSPSYYLYILKGGQAETWQPKFTYYGFRYIQIQGAVVKTNKNLSNKPVVLSVKALHIRNAAKSVGNFECSNELFNQTNKLIDWAIKSNMVSVFTDCPHREKLGWLEEAHLVGSSVKYEYDIASLCRKIIKDMQMAQTAEGLIPDIAPEYVVFDGGFRDSPEWGSNGILLPWYLYQWYGDKQTLEDSYGMMQRYIQYLDKQAVNHILLQGLGDWYDLGPDKPGFAQLTPAGVTATAIYYHDLTILSQIANLLQKTTDANAYIDQGKLVKDAFNKRFFNTNTKQYGTGSQTANAMALYMDLVEVQNRKAVVNNLLVDLKARNYALTAGDIGYRYLLKVLNQEGRSDVIFKMNNRSDVPGYGFQLAHGATALTESWQALPVVSNNHFMLGHLMEWFYEGVAGIYAAADAIAYDKIVIHPQVVGNLTSAKANYQSAYGLISSEWNTKDGFTLQVKIPVNTKALVYLPTKVNAVITESGKPYENNSQLKLIKKVEGQTVFEIGSGTYFFKVKKATIAQTKKWVVADSVMEIVYQEIKTPYKYGMVIVPESNDKKIDCPTVFREGNKWYMSYLLFDGKGYETYLAESVDLLNWNPKGKIMSSSADTTRWDAHQKGGYMALQDEDWGGTYHLQKYNQQYWMSYIGGNVKGYEAGELAIGIAYTKNAASLAKEWNYLSNPVLTSHDKDTRWWENKKEYKSSIIWDKEKTLGYSFLMYYNANGDSSNGNKKIRWFERIGMAVSNDMLHWKRYINEPIMQHPIGITGDAVVQKMGKLWVMFYYGAFWEGRKDAFNRFACSYDLVHWTDWKGADLINSSEPYDEKYAHKSFVLKYQGVVYHFYCATNNKDQRGIAVATSKDKGKSVVNFITQ